MANQEVIGVNACNSINGVKLADSVAREKIQELKREVANVGDAFSEWETYEVGDYCIYENVLYRCNTDITTAGAWDASYWTATSITAEIGLLRETISDLEESLADGMIRITAKLNDLEERIPTIVLDEENQTAYITTNQE